MVPFWDKYYKLNSRAVSNTFRYIFFKFKKGIFIKIHDNKLETFLPFSNVNFENEWSEKIQVEPKYKNIKNFIDYISKLSGYRPQKEIKPVNEWIANNGLFRYEIQKNEGDNNVVVLYDMFKTLCEERNIPDIEFFINRRDFPLLTRDETEPYNHIYDTTEKKLLSHIYPQYSPILSASTSEK